MSFDSGFDGPDELPLVKGLTQKWVTVDSRDKSGKPKDVSVSLQCNQEPCYEELQVQRLRGAPSHKLREEALDARKALNGGFLTLPPHLVKQAVEEACAVMDAHRATMPKLYEFQKIGRVPF